MKVEKEMYSHIKCNSSKNIISYNTFVLECVFQKTHKTEGSEVIESLLLALSIQLHLKVHASHNGIV